MVWTGVLRAVLPLFLLFSGIWDVEGQETIDPTALNSIANVINIHASQTASSSAPGHQEPRQYAMAIRIAKNQCQQNFDVNNFNSLNNDVDAFRNQLGGKDVYKGNVMVAASYRNEKHSEYRLLMEGEVTVIDKLLETTGSTNVEDCVIFYTYNSPCLKTCLNQEEYKKAELINKERKKKGRKPIATYRCIYCSLDIFNRVSGPKAFVFTQIYREDMNKQELSECLGKITEKLPLYQCDNNKKCRRCDQGNSYCTVTATGADLAG